MVCLLQYVPVQSPLQGPPPFWQSCPAFLLLSTLIFPEISPVVIFPEISPFIAQKPLMPNSLRAEITADVQLEMNLKAFLPCAFCFLLTILFLLFFMRSERDCPDAVFSLLPMPLKTTTFANLPRAILLTAFFFITRPFIAVFAFATFMLFMVVFITDFFIGRAIVNLRRNSRDRGKVRELARGLEPSNDKKQVTCSTLLRKSDLLIISNHCLGSSR